MAPPFGNALPVVVATSLLLPLILVIPDKAGPDHASWPRLATRSPIKMPARRLFAPLALFRAGAATLAVLLRRSSLPRRLLGLCFHRYTPGLRRIAESRKCVAGCVEADREAATLKRLVGLYADPSQIAVAHIAHRLALQAGIAPDDADELRATAMLYQIGRVGMPAALLCRRGPLDPSELALLRRQPAIGARLLADGQMALLDRAAELALCHQECWNGSGYPRGLAGLRIPLPARIVTIAAALDALLRQASVWPLDQLALHMNQNAGRLFDPDLVRILLSDLPAMVASRDIAPAVPLPTPYRPLRIAARQPVLL